MSVMSNQKGFTLAELLVGSALLSILLGTVGWFINYSAGVNQASAYEQRSNKFIERLGKYYDSASQSIKSDKLNQNSTFDDTGLNLILRPSQDSVTENTRYRITALGTTTLAQWQARGLPVGEVPAVGVQFIASTTGLLGGSGTVASFPLTTWRLDNTLPVSDLDLIPEGEKRFPIFNLVRNYIQSIAGGCFNSTTSSSTCSTNFLRNLGEGQFMQDSHGLESPRMIVKKECPNCRRSFQVDQIQNNQCPHCGTVFTDNGDLEKVFSYYLVSRCLPRTASTLSSAGDGRSSITPQAPELSAYYVLVMLNRRPFYDTQLTGGARDSSVRCCPVSNPNCTDGSVANYLVRTYGIKMDLTSNRPVTVTEYPSIGEFDPVLGSGFMLTLNMNLNTYKLKTFNILNQCLFGAGRRCQKFEENPVAIMPNWYRKIKSDVKNGVLEKSLASGGLIKIGESK